MSIYIRVDGASFERIKMMVDQYQSKMKSGPQKTTVINGVERLIGRKRIPHATLTDVTQDVEDLLSSANQRIPPPARRAAEPDPVPEQN